MTYLRNPSTRARLKQLAPTATIHGLDTTAARATRMSSPWAVDFASWKKIEKGFVYQAGKKE